MCCVKAGQDFEQFKVWTNFTHKQLNISFSKDEEVVCVTEL